MNPDFGATAEDYAKHRAGFPDSLYDRLAELGAWKPGQTLVDLGTGTGTLARGFARRGCRVIGIDISAPLLDQARELATAEGLAIDFRIASAEETGLQAESADVVSAGQCWHWFDRARAAAEVRRILVPGGTVIIAYFDWIPITENVVHATEALIREHNPDWKYGGNFGVQLSWLRELGEAGFEDIQTFSYEVDVPYTHEGWRGRIRASAGVGASTLTPEQVRAFDEAHAAMLEERFPEEILQVHHRVFAVVGSRGGEAASSTAQTHEV